MKITLVTGNWAKIAQAKEFLEPKGITVDNVKMDTIEIQADSVEEVAKYSAKWASEELKANVVKNDTGIMIDALDGFPAAYTHYVQDTIGMDGILKLMKGVKNRKAKFVQALAFCEYGKEPVSFVSVTEGEISLKKKENMDGVGTLYLFQKVKIKLLLVLKIVKDFHYGMILDICSYWNI